MFFLVKGAPRILLGQPFTRATKLTFEHGEDGSMDAVFRDSKTERTCIVSVVGSAHAFAEERRKKQQATVESDEEGN